MGFAITREGRVIAYRPRSPSTAQLDVLEIELEDRHFEVAGSGFLLVEEEDPDIFFADIGFGRIGLARTRHDANFFGGALPLASSLSGPSINKFS